MSWVVSLLAIIFYKVMTMCTGGELVDSPCTTPWEDVTGPGEAIGPQHPSALRGGTRKMQPLLLARVPCLAPALFPNKSEAKTQVKDALGPVRPVWSTLPLGRKPRVFCVCLCDSGPPPGCCRASFSSAQPRAAPAKPSLTPGSFVCLIDGGHLLTLVGTSGPMLVCLPVR